ncbi:MAG: hypothetical protein HKP27_02670 [Myxococcales bacterium]|nr:hypothetical protein [Myxococcales bacterium]
MGGLGHTFESQGIATTQISLVREHTAVMQPPRALWVPFELGRPLGSPSQASFQKKVSLAALQMLEEETGPVLRDFPDDAPEVAETAREEWACPISLPSADADPSDIAARFRTEFAGLRGWYEAALRENGSTTFGAAGLSVDEIGRFIEAVAGGTEEVPSQAREQSFQNLIKLVSEDIRAIYLEAVAAQPAKRRASSRELSSWFFGETAAGELFHQLAADYRRRDDPGFQLLGSILLVPAGDARRA